MAKTPSDIVKHILGKDVSKNNEYIHNVVSARRINNVRYQVEKLPDGYYRYFIYANGEVMKGDPTKTLSDAEREAKDIAYDIANMK